MATPIVVYGTDWCEDTQNTRRHLDALGIHYSYVDIEQDPRASAWVKQQNAGKQITPTVKLEGMVLTEPAAGELDSALRARGLMA